MPRKTVDLRSQAELDFDRQMDEMRDAMDSSKDILKFFKDAGMGDAPAAKVLEQESENWKLEWDLRLREMPTEDIKSTKEMALKGGSDFLQTAFDLVLRPLYAPAGAIEEVLRAIAPEGSSEGEALDSIYNSMQDGRQLAAVSGRDVPTTGLIAAGHRVFSLMQNGEGVDFLKTAVQRLARAKQTGSLDRAITKRVSNEIFSGLGPLKGEKKTFRDVMEDRDLEKGPSVTEVIEGVLGQTSVPNPFAAQPEVIPTALGGARVEGGGLGTAIFGSRIGFTSDGKGLLSLKTDGIFDPRTEDLDAFAPDVFLDPSMYITAGSSGMAKAGGRSLTKKGMKVLAGHEAVEAAARKSALAAAITPESKLELEALHTAISSREVAERMLLEEARRDGSLLRPRGEVRFMGTPIVSLGGKEGEQTVASRFVQSKRVEAKYRKFRKALAKAVSSPNEARKLGEVLEAVGSTGRRIGQVFRAEESMNPEWLAARARAEGGAHVKMRNLDNNLNASKLKQGEHDLLLGLLSDPMTRRPGAAPALTDAQLKVLEQNGLVDEVYSRLAQEAVKPIKRQRIKDLISLMQLDHRFGMSRRLSNRLSFLTRDFPDELADQRVEVFFRNADKDILEYTGAIASQFPTIRVDEIDKVVRLAVKEKRGIVAEQAAQPLYDELLGLFNLRFRPGLKPNEIDNAKTIYNRRIKELLHAEQTRAETLLAKGDRGGIITPMSREDLLEMIATIRKANPRLPKLNAVSDPLEHVRRRGQVAYGKEAQHYLIDKAQKLARDDEFARNLIERDLVSIGALERHANVNRANVDDALDEYMRSISETVTETRRKEVIESVPLGQDRLPVIDLSLEDLSPEKFDELLRARVEAADNLAAVTSASSIEDQLKLAKAQDELQAVQHELVRRRAKEMTPNDLAKELAGLNLENPSDKVKALLLMSAAKEQGPRGLRDLAIVLRSLDRDPRFRAFDINDQFDKLRELADSLKNTGEPRKIGLDPEPMRLERDVVRREVHPPTGRAMTKAMAKLKTKEEKQLFLRKWMFGEGNLSRRWEPGTLPRRFWEVMNYANDVPGWQEGGVKVVKFGDEFGNESQLMRNWIDEALTVRAELAKEGLDMHDMLPRANLSGFLGPDGTKIKPFRGIVRERGRWRLTTEGRGPALYLPESLVRSLQRFSEEAVKNPEVAGALKAFDFMQNFLKLNLTALGGFPAFQARNYIGNTAFGLTAAGIRFLNPKHMGLARKMAWINADPRLILSPLGHRNALRMQVMQDISVGLGEKSEVALADIMQSMKRFYPGSKQLLSDKPRKSIQKILDTPGGLKKEARDIKAFMDQIAVVDDLGREYRVGDILREIPRQRVDIDPRLLAEFTGQFSEVLGDPGKLRLAMKAAKDKLLRSNAFFEQWSRQHLFMTFLERGVGYEEAGRLANKWMLDYARLSGTEKAVFKRIFPFYTFYRKTVPLMLESIYTRPGATAFQAKILREPDEPVFSFGTERGERIVIKRDGNMYVIGNVDLPIKSLKLLNVFYSVAGKGRAGREGAKQGWRDITLMLHPFIQTMFSESSDFELFQDRKVMQKKVDAVGLAIEKAFGRDSRWFTSGTIRKTEGPDGNQHYYINRNLFTVLAQSLGTARLLSNADRLLQTTHELQDGEVMGLIQWLSGLKPMEVSGNESELLKLRAVEQALVDEGQRRGIFRKGEFVYKIDHVD